MTQPPYRIIPARSSKDCELESKIILADMTAIGVHENVQREKFEGILESIVEKGYRGPPIAIMESRNGLFERAVSGEELEISKPFALGIVDGHNRLAVLKLLYLIGVMKNRIIPVQLLSVKSKMLRTCSLDPAREPLSITQIQASNADPRRSLSQSHTFFQVELRGGNKARIREGQPDLIMSKEELFDSSHVSVSDLRQKESIISEYISVQRLTEILKKHLHVI